MYCYEDFKLVPQEGEKNFTCRFAYFFVVSTNHGSSSLVLIHTCVQVKLLLKSDLPSKLTFKNEPHVESG